jgi:cardiolipin synthase
MSTPLTILLTALTTLIIAFIVRSLTSREKKITHKLEHLFAIEDPQFLRSMVNLLPPAALPGNKITTLTNGDQFFPAMLHAIRSAQHSVTFETFIYWQGEVGKQFAEALADRAKNGVKVHVLLDWLGTKKMDPRSIDLMQDAGVEIERYHPLRWYNLRRVNNRTHRKLLVIDGKIAFTGGAGIADLWMGNAQDKDHWRDTHFQVEGPVVAQCQAAFTDNWLKTRSRVLNAREYFPALTEAGPHLAQMFMSSPAEGSESARLMFLLSIASAAKSVKIASAYFVPDDLSVQTLIEATKRGVKVEVIVPGKFIDTHITRRASRARWGPLLKAGVEIHEYQPTMFHCKCMIVDNLWTSIGSANFDNRSFRLNDEANLNIYDKNFAAEQTQAFENDKQKSKQITWQQWKNRPLPEKLKEHTAALLRSQL